NGPFDTRKVSQIDDVQNELVNEDNACPGSKGSDIDYLANNGVVDNVCSGVKLKMTKFKNNLNKVRNNKSKKIIVILLRLDDLSVFTFLLE
ncbi:2331_t:CDS:2, partial [Entrophospora sp. SA101]